MDAFKPQETCTTNIFEGKRKMVSQDGNSKVLSFLCSPSEKVEL